MSELWQEIKLGWKYRNYPLLITLSFAGILLYKIFVFAGRCFYLFWTGVPFDVFLQVITFYSVFAFYLIKTLPPQNFWDPNHKLLLTPGKANNWDRFAVQCLHRLRLQTSRKPLPPLPPEIWEMILELVIDVPYVFDTCCDSNDFHRFIETLSIRSFESSKLYMASETERKNLRLVCKMWDELLPQTPRWLSSIEQPRTIDEKVKRFDLTISGPPDTVPDLHTGFNMSAICIHVFAFHNELQNLIQLALDKAHSVSSIRTFSYTYENISPPFLSLELQARFSSLTTLYIETVELYGPLRLDKLEVLYWNIYRCDQDQWWFPSLRHCALGDRIIGSNKFQPSLIPGPTHQLQSLYFPKQGSWMTMDDAFWQDFPCLEYLGVYNHMADIAHPGAPSHHPLRHIAFNDASKEDINFYNFVQLTNLVPNLRRVTLPSNFGQEDDKALHDTCLFLFQEHCKRGIDWVDKEGNPIRFQRLTVYRKWTLYDHLTPLFCGTFSWVNFSIWVLTLKDSSSLSPYQLYVSVVLLFFYVGLAIRRIYECHISPNYVWIRGPTG
jgi:hypothetical protein